MQNEVIAFLNQHGWDAEPLALGPTKWIGASKFYTNVAGGRDAVIYVHGCKVTAEYMSESNNALSTCIILNMQDATELAAFLNQIERKINGTYGRRLMA